MSTPTDEDRAARAAESTPLRQVRTFVGWLGTGRKLTQTGRVTMKHARELVGLLGTGDEIDPQIGERVFRTKSSEELSGLLLVVEWAKAARLVRVNRGWLAAPATVHPRPIRCAPCRSPTSRRAWPPWKAASVS